MSSGKYFGTEDGILVVGVEGEWERRIDLSKLSDSEGLRASTIDVWALPAYLDKDDAARRRHWEMPPARLDYWVSEKYWERRHFKYLCCGMDPAASVAATLYPDGGTDIVRDKTIDALQDEVEAAGQMITAALLKGELPYPKETSTDPRQPDGKGCFILIKSIDAARWIDTDIYPYFPPALLSIRHAAPADTAAAAAQIEFVEGGMLNITIDGKSQRVSCSEFGLADGRGSGLNKQGALLLGWAQGKIIPENARRSVSRLRNILRDKLQIDNPLPKTENGWEPVFPVIDGRNKADKRAKDNAMHLPFNDNYPSPTDEEYPYEDEGSDGDAWLNKYG